jgi:hypothetical protein
MTDNHVCLTDDISVFAGIAAPFLDRRTTKMKKVKRLTLALACGLVLAASATGFAQGNPQDNKSKKPEACCAANEGKEDKDDCCKGDACCKKESCCCKGGECPMHPHDSKKSS